MIEDEFKRALGVLDDVLQYIEEHKPQPALRVMMLNNTIVAIVSIMEETLRDVFKVYLTILEEGFTDYRWLRAQLRSTNLESAIQLLREHRSESDFDSSAVVRDLAR